MTSCQWSDNRKPSMHKPSDLNHEEPLTSVIHGPRDGDECGRIQRENRNPGFGLMQVSAQQLQPLFFTADIPCTPVYRTNATFRQCIRIKMSARQRTLETMSVTPLRTFRVYRTARMTTWKAFEAIVDNVAVRLVTYCHS